MLEVWKHTYNLATWGPLQWVGGIPKAEVQGDDNKDVSKYLPLAASVIAGVAAGAAAAPRAAQAGAAEAGAAHGSRVLSQAGSSGGPVHLYRAVSSAELADIAANGFRSGGPTTMEAKLFTTTPQYAGTFARLLHCLSGQSSTIVRVRIPQSVAAQLEYFTADGMPTVAVQPEAMPAFNGAAHVEVMPFIPIH